ncbi:olfactory receptor 14A2-like [Notamacropus eugenii]|uniref:olfactory receptor 14A2-like n=1 Tax=Notamacropus eugenii TaxID=9315 RepID=UPI003B67487D
MANFTMVRGFLLMGFSKTWELQVLHAMLFLLIYLVALMGNLLIFTLISLDGHLHNPMYFFLKNLSFLDFCLISTTVPKSIVNSLSCSHSISSLGCMLQFFLVILFSGLEIFLLTATSYDHYVAICQPLHYDVIMNKGNCLRMAVVSWITGGLFGVLYSANTFSLTFCGSNEIHQFFCYTSSLLRIFCSDSYIAVHVTVAIRIIIGTLCCISIAISYGHIFSTVLKIQTTEGRSKVFSTCLPHLVVLLIFITTAFMDYLKPPWDSASILDLLLPVFYIVVPPTLNPVIYSLRNKDIQISVKKLMSRKYFSERLIPKSFP